jgi:hypothetical protein
MEHIILMFHLFFNQFHNIYQNKKINLIIFIIININFDFIYMKYLF